MTELLITTLIWFCAVGCGLMAGLYFAFSTFIMTALGRLGPAQGSAAMNAINATIVRSLFLPVFFGTTLASLTLAVYGGSQWGTPGAPALLAGGAIYIVGMFLCTMAFNVPLNNALAAAGHANADVTSTWGRYLRNWTRWNHVRTLSSTIASAAFIASLAAR